MVIANSRTALVTGAASGIGGATAELLLERGWNVIAADLDRDRLEASFSPSENCLTAVVDVSRSASVDALYEGAVDRFGGLSAVANIAGVTDVDDRAIEFLDERIFDQTIAVNLRGAFLSSKRAIPLLRAAGGGAIVNMGSVASVRGVGGTAYVTSKHGLVGLSRAIAYHHATDNIRCNVIGPGATDTPMFEISKQKGGTVVDRPGTLPGLARPAEIAGLVAFLVSDEARYITGATYVIDGGATQY
jgi:NAD(P)-dependent dehydrogenase (short-subunit alcohol dehydrogenase family)